MKLNFSEQKIVIKKLQWWCNIFDSYTSGTEKYKAIKRTTTKLLEQQILAQKYLYQNLEWEVCKDLNNSFFTQIEQQIKDIQELSLKAMSFTQCEVELLLNARLVEVIYERELGIGTPQNEIIGRIKQEAQLFLHPSDPDESVSRFEMKKFKNFTYYGFILGGQRSGFGRMEFEQGDLYSGNFNNDKKNGYGEFQWQNGEHYEGQFEDNCMIEGSYTFYSKDVYKGAWRGGVRFGNATYTFADGSLLTGTFEDPDNWLRPPEQDRTVEEPREKLSQKCPCRGSIQYSNGDHYSGEIQEMRPHGVGCMKYKNGEQYSGEWDAGEPHGQGEHTFKNGDTYAGKHERGKMIGGGTITYMNGDEYFGDVVDGQPHGHGELTNKEGVRVHEGRWKGGRYDWFGYHIYENGDKYEGYYEGGECSGKGTYRSKNGDKYVGNYKNGLKNGRGREKLKSGEQFEGEYVDDRRVIGVWRWASGDTYIGEVEWRESENRYVMQGRGKLIERGGGVSDGVWRDDELVEGK